jgi:hypothetical protein
MNMSVKILLDYDDWTVDEILEHHRYLREKTDIMVSYALGKSRDELHHHVELAVEGDWSNEETVAIQALFGSDPAREWMNLWRLRSKEVFNDWNEFWRSKNGVRYQNDLRLSELLRDLWYPLTLDGTEPPYLTKSVNEANERRQELKMKDEAFKEVFPDG